MGLSIYRMRTPETFAKRLAKIFFHSLLAAWFVIPAAEGWAQEPRAATQRLILNGKPLVVEVARTEREKERGLMFRERLGKDEGMLFIYEEEGILSFWMKNTRLPLSIAFLTGSGEIIDIQDMEPFSLRNHRSSLPAKYALEVNRGWFGRNGIRVGHKINLPATLAK